jgi:hypothetical protein
MHTTGRITGIHALIACLSRRATDQFDATHWSIGAGKDFLHDHLDNLPDVPFLVNGKASSMDDVRRIDYATISLNIRTANEKMAYVP